MAIFVRAVRDDDYPVLAPAISAITPAEPHTAEALRHLDVYLERRGMGPARVLAEDEHGALLGHGLRVGRGSSQSVDVGGSAGRPPAGRGHGACG